MPSSRFNALNLAGGFFGFLKQTGFLAFLRKSNINTTAWKNQLRQ